MRVTKEARSVLANQRRDEVRVTARNSVGDLCTSLVAYGGREGLGRNRRDAGSAGKYNISQSEPGFEHLRHIWCLLIFCDA
jgi:hypothetical protein